MTSIVYLLESKSWTKNFYHRADAEVEPWSFTKVIRYLYIFLAARFSNVWAVWGGWITGQYSGPFLVLPTPVCLPVSNSLFFCVPCLVERSQAVCKINARHWEGLFQTKTKKYRPFVPVGQMLRLTCHWCADYMYLYVYPNINNLSKPSTWIWEDYFDLVCFTTVLNLQTLQFNQTVSLV